MLDAVGATRYTYSASGAVASEDGPWASDTVSYTYDNGRRRSSLSLQQPMAAAWAQSYAYDAIRRLTNVTSAAGPFGYTYHPGLDTNGALSPASLVQRLTLPGGAVLTNAYDPWARHLATHLRTSGGTLLNGHDYTYNDRDQRTRQTRTGGDYVDYAYDSLGQLIGASGRESGGSTRAHEQLKYLYDAAGNLTKRTNNALVQTFNVNTLNELTSAGRSGTYTVAGAVQGTASSVTVNGSAATLYADQTFAQAGVSLTDGTNTFTAVATDTLGRWDTNTVTAYLPATVTFAYDLNGNLRTNGTRLLDYDDENQLIRITEPGAWLSEFVYDGKMRRRIRREYVWQSAIWNLQSEIQYVYDGNLVIQERHYTPHLSTNHPQQLITYTRGLDLSDSLEGAGGIGGLLSRTASEISNLESPSHAYYHADGNGNITCLIATNQAAVARYLYDPFGNQLAATGPLAEANLYRFSSKEWHPSSSLVYYGYRFYDPTLQRWLNRDPLLEFGGRNLFRLVKNNPVSTIDPFGLRGPLLGPPPQLVAPLLVGAGTVVTSSGGVVFAAGAGMTGGASIPMTIWLVLQSVNAPVQYPDPQYTGVYNPVPSRVLCTLPSPSWPPPKKVFIPGDPQSEEALELCVDWAAGLMAESGLNAGEDENWDFMFDRMVEECMHDAGYIDYKQP
jgi:RHS repeat-associated protein